MVNNTQYSAPEFAKLVGVSRIAVFKWIRSGKLPAKKIGRNYVIESSDISRFTNQPDDSSMISDFIFENYNDIISKVATEYHD